MGWVAAECCMGCTGNAVTTTIRMRAGRRDETRSRVLLPIVMPIIALAALALAGCTAANMSGVPQVSLPDPPKQAEMLPGAQREHQRILQAYGGAYNDARLEGLVTKTVERLVASSERPELKYKVTILNSSAVNAFALPSGNLYITRGLIALANDNAELASVLAHEMSHVLARHAAIREDQARQAAIVS